MRTDEMAEVLRGPQSALIDSFGRKINYLRVSITDRCNLRCQYCMSARGMHFVEKESWLSAQDFGWVAGVAGEVGIEHVRVTGGEPLTRGDVIDVVKNLRAAKNIQTISMTSNGILLTRYAQSLADVGLDRLNISMDSLHAERFAKITRGGKLARIWEGIFAANACLIPLKINVVILANFNADEVETWIEAAAKMDLTVRFLELMPVGPGARLAQLGQFLDLETLREHLCHNHKLTPCPDIQGNGPARYWTLPHGRGRIGFITPMSRSYCNTCNRLRLTCDGHLRPCLASDLSIPCKDIIVSRDAEALCRAFQSAADLKPAGHRWRDGHTSIHGMSTLGG
jgi:cyclic pyranopterin phosphate synthase